MFAVSLLTQAKVGVHVGGAFGALLTSSFSMPNLIHIWELEKD